jgi:hypothetical protein
MIYRAIDTKLALGDLPLALFAHDVLSPRICSLMIKEALNETMIDTSDWWLITQQSQKDISTK